MEAPEEEEEEKKKKKKKKKIPVVYYLCRNRRIEHPHFIEVPLSSPEGLYLRDVINRLNLVRGKGMPTMYSWSCKRSYKNGFVWHDLSHDDLVLPANGDEYVLKGSELLDQPSSDRIHPNNGNPKLKNPKQPPQQESPKFSRSKEAPFASSSPPTVVVRESNPPPSPQEDEKEEEEEEEEVSSQEYVSSGSAEYRVYRPIGSSDAATQTDDENKKSDHHDKENENLTTVVSTDNGSTTLDSINNHARLSNGSRSETLESLLRADARNKNIFRRLKEEEVLIPTGPKMKPGNILMQLITCGSFTVKDHESYGIVSNYQPSFSHMKFQSSVFARSSMLGELDCLSKDPRLMGLKLEDKEYFSGSLIETKKHREDIGERMPVLKRSSSYNAERKCRKCKLESRRHGEEIEDTSVTRCLPRAIKLTPPKQPKNEKITSPISDCPRCSSVGPECDRSSIGESSRSITHAASVHGSSMRLESLKEEKEKLIRIEERLMSGARVIIQSRIPCDDSADGSDT
ncbi:protein UPSTREAM OF FLC-like isoform X1 [Ananas comosus]|uniref:Protein UPSTREAM OF FLC-like isoform X1 n=1 Tax=Ananas comosus TaxID=4615 RepID=A0A6P5FD59_ANACO|nr:protein UPSTREAM OF FLC-like isoform X1 [Ananas comosus]XP_020091359.1 protein UPSTREAM OF FLC-like isoform X1 [Ananas comosus]